MTRNEKLLQSFPQTQPPTKSLGGAPPAPDFARLVDIEGKYLWEFLYNPSREQFDYSAKYAESPTAATALPHQQYLYSSAQARTFSDLLLESHADGRSLQQHLDKLLEATKPVAERLEPPLLFFQWGNYKFGTCRLVSVSGTYEPLRLLGEPSWVQLSITLIEAPNLPGVATENGNPDSLGDRTSAKSPVEKITPQTTTRQVIERDAIAAARQALGDSFSALSGIPLRFSFDKRTDQVQIKDSRNNSLIGLFSEATGLKI